MLNKTLTLLLSALLLAGNGSLSAQNKPGISSGDYAAYPYWIDMMQNPQGNFFEIQKAFNSYWEGREVTKGSGYKPFKRWEWYWQSRINPDGTFPQPGHVYREYNNYIQSHPAGTGLKSGQAFWSELGPKTRVNYGGYVGVGRLNAIACHPMDTSTVYAGAPSGGLWKTTDGGKNWTVLTDQMPSLGVSSILIHPSKPDDILVGTGDRDHGDARGIGVLHSSDGGATWEIYNNGMGDRTVGMMARSETDPDLILAATDGGIYKTIDGGAHWQLKYNAGGSFKDIKLNPGNSKVAYATSVSAVGFYRSEDAGETWNRIPETAGLPSVGRIVIGVTPAASNLVYLVCGNVGFVGCYLSSDNGKSFNLQSSSPNILGWAPDGSDEKSQAWYDLSIQVDPENAEVIHVGGINLWRSDNGGKTWKITGHWTGDQATEVHADQHTFFYNPVNKRLYAGNDGGIYCTDDLGATWKEISEGLGIGQLYKLGVSISDAHKIIGGFQDNGGATWTGTSWLSTGDGDRMECAVDPSDNRNSYAALYNGIITRYLNNTDRRDVAGNNINRITEEGAWVTPFLLGEAAGNIMVAGYKNIWISRNVSSEGTITWTKISDNLGGRNDVNMSVLEQSPADVNILYAARSDGKVFRTDNLLTLPVSWTDLTSMLPGSGNPSDFECHPYDPHVVYMTLNQKVYKSEDKGFSWKNISGSLPSISINSIAFDKSSKEGLYIGTDAGVYFRDAGMTDWVLYGQSLPVSIEISEVEIYQDLRNRDDSRVRVSTFGRGIWEIPLAPSNAVLPPALLTTTVLDRDVELNWVPPFYEQNILGYRIYRNGQLLTLTRSPGYTDIRLESDRTFTYKVSALYPGGLESGFTNEAAAIILAPIEIPYNQTFEKGTAGFTAKFSIEGWRYGTAETLAVTGREGYFFAANSAQAGEGVTVKDYLVSPEIDLTGFTGKTITLKFAYTMRKYRTYDKFSVVYRPSPDSAWTNLVDLAPPSKVDWVWDTTQVNLPRKALTARTQIGFLYDNSNQFAWGAAVDDVNLYLNTTSVHSIDNLMSLKVFPNPNQGLFTIELASLPAGEIKIEVHTITGQAVFEKLIQNPSGKLVEMIDLSTQPKGTYQLTIRMKTSEWKQKLMIQ